MDWAMLYVIAIALLGIQQVSGMSQKIISTDVKKTFFN